MCRKQRQNQPTLTISPKLHSFATQTQVYGLPLTPPSPLVNSPLHKMPKTSTDQSIKQPSQHVPAKLTYVQTKTSIAEKATHLTHDHDTETTKVNVNPEPKRRGRGRPKKNTETENSLEQETISEQQPAPVTPQVRKREKEHLSSDEAVPQPPPKRTKTKQVKVINTSHHHKLK